MSGLDDMPPLDLRKHNVVDRAEAELGVLVAKLIEQHDLTYGEAISILTAVTSRWAVRLVRFERETEEAEDAEEHAGEHD